MSAASWSLLGVAAALAAVDWWAVWSERSDIRFLTKPAVLTALIASAMTLDPADGRIRATMVVGLVLSLVGDVFLLLDERWFVAGLGAFLVGHLAYVVGFQFAPTSVAATLVGLAVVVVAVATVGRRIVTTVASGEHRALTGPVVAYLVVISAMVVSAFGTMAAWAIVGAVLFYVSDATLAWNRFVARRRFGPLGVMVTYHLGQAGLIGWLAWP
ncbi:MAG: lysoplasmalogenase [Acidimicrobiales bacterium]